VADGHPNHRLREWDCDHIVLPESHHDNGNTPRCIGAISAINHGYWPIFFLDADNWLYNNHVSKAITLKQQNPDADVLAMRRDVALPDGTIVPGIPDEDLNQTHIDTSSYVFYPSAFRVLSIWGMMPPYLGPVCDRFIFTAVNFFKLKVVWSTTPTYVFTANYSWAYNALKRPAPLDVHDIDWEQIEHEFDPREIYERTGLSSWINK